MKYITVSAELRKACEAKMEETLDICRKKYGKDIPTPPLKFAQLGRRAGICQYTHGIWDTKVTALIVINPDFFKNHYDDMLNDTVPHEVAHYIAIFIHGQKAHGHGWLWKSVMHAIGLSGDRCHEYSLEDVKVKTIPRPFKYSCGCSDGHTLTAYKHRQHFDSIGMGRRRLQCRRCRKYLTYEGIIQNGVFTPSQKRTPVVPEPVRIVQVFNIVPPAQPITVTEPESKFKTVTRFVNGMLENVKVPIEA